MTERADVPLKIVAKLRQICLALPDAYEERAWVGTRWMIRKQTFAHVLMIDAGWPPAYARVAGSPGPICVLTFRSPLAALDASAYASPPFFRPGWWPNIVGLLLVARVDWDEVACLLTESYCVFAPKRLAALVGGPEITARGETRRRREAGPFQQLHKSPRPPARKQGSD